MSLSEIDQRFLELDLVHYMRKNAWNSKLVCKLINYKYGVSYRFDDIEHIYQKLITKQSLYTLLNK